MRPGGPTNMALDARLPEGSVSLNATTLRKTHEVFIIGNSKSAKQDEPFKDFPFDDKKLGLMRYALTKFSDEFWIPLRVDNDNLHIDDEGRVTATMGYPEHVRWLDHGNQVKAMKSTPVDALELLVQELNFSFWNLSIVGGDVKIAFSERVRIERISKYEGGDENKLKSKLSISQPTLHKLEQDIKQNSKKYFRYSSDHPRIHAYFVATPICKVGKSPRTQSNVWQALLRFPAPGMPGDGSLQSGDVSDLFLVGKVYHIVDASSYTVINYTTPSHLLHDGAVMRKVVVAEGTVIVLTYGEGTGPMPDMNISEAKGVWSSVDRNIIAAIASMGRYP